MKMNAIVCTQYGTPDVLQLQEVDMPIPKEQELLIKVQAAAITTAGLIGRKGLPRFSRLFSGLFRPKKAILGMELAGEIRAIGKGVSSFKTGDQVFGLTGLRLGSNAEYACLAEDAALLPKPTNMTYEESAAIVEGGLTALNFLRSKGKIKAGQRVLIYGASGSVGTASIQIAKYLGAHVTGVCSTANLDLVKSLGAHEVIDYTRQDFTQNGQAYDLIFDTVGKCSFLNCRGSLKSNGIYLAAAGLSTVFHMLWTKWFSRQKAILATTYLRSTEAIKEDLVAVKLLVEAGVLKSVIDKRYTLEQTPDAHRYVETGRKKGNVVITLS